MEKFRRSSSWCVLVGVRPKWKQSNFLRVEQIPNILERPLSSTTLLCKVKMKVREISFTLFIVLLTLLNIGLTKQDRSGHWRGCLAFPFGVYFGLDRGTYLMSTPCVVHLAWYSTLTISQTLVSVKQVSNHSR
jgi:hypothetical protein